MEANKMGHFNTKKKESFKKNKYKYKVVPDVNGVSLNQTYRASLTYYPIELNF